MPRTPWQTRRAFLTSTGAALVGAATASGTATAAVNGWREVPSPTGKTIHEVVMTKEGPFAVASGGDVLARRADGWELVLEKGPTVQSNPLRGAGVTDDGKHLWFCGGSGVIGMYDVDEERLTDFSAPMGKTSTWLDVAVTEPAGSDRVYLMNGSGEFLSGRMTDAGGMDWGDVVKPGGGSSAPGIDAYDETEVRVCDTTTKVYDTTNGGDTWTTIGIDGGENGLYDIASVSEATANVAAGGGYIYRYDEDAGWTGIRVGESAVRGVTREGGDGLACGGGGFVYELTEYGWEQFETPVTNTLKSAIIDTTGTYPDVAVGGSGTIIERDDYTATPPHTVSIAGTDGTTTGYEFTVDGAVVKASSAESDDSIDGDTVTGTVGGDTDAYDFSGEITDFAVTSGSASNITITVDGTTKTVEELDDDPWVEASSPTGKTLHSVVESADGAFAVGGGGDAVIRRDGDWRFAFEYGPSGESNPLRDASVSADGQNVWFAGGSGVIGKYDVIEERLTDYSAPKGKTSTWEGIAVGGDAGAETIYVLNGSGEVLTGENDDGDVTWGDVVKPGGGASMKAAGLVDDATAYIVDTNAKVYETKDSGASWSTVGIGGGSVGLYGVTAVSEDDIAVTGGDGSIFRYNGAVWTKNNAGGNGLYGIQRVGETGLAAGGSGAIFELTDDGWEQDPTPVSNTLRDAVVGQDGPDVAVGGSGTIVERRE